nr:hypothetical protein [Mycobacterium sp. UM_NZ2]
MSRDIIDDIDALIDEQLATGPVDDYSVNRYDKCWHCGRDWHGLATALCPGSDFIGPVQQQGRVINVAETLRAAHAHVAVMIDSGSLERFRAAIRRFADAFTGLVEVASAERPAVRFHAAPSTMMVAGFDGSRSDSLAVTVPSDDQAVSTRRRERQRLNALARQQTIEATRRNELVERYRARMRELAQ